MSNKCYTTSISTKSYNIPLNTVDYPHLPNTDLFRFLKELPPLDSNGPWVAGGAVWRAVNNEPLDNCDIDIFFQNNNQYEEGCRKMNSIPFVNHIISETRKKYNTTYKFHVSQGKTYNKTINVQLIGIDFRGTLNELLDGFDFAVCQFGYDGKNLIVGPTSLDALSKKSLTINRVTKPKSMIRHMLKYMNNGFTMPNEQIKYLFGEIIQMDVWKKSAGEDYNDNNEKKESLYGREDIYDAGASIRPSFGYIHNSSQQMGIVSESPSNRMMESFPEDILDPGVFRGDRNRRRNNRPARAAANINNNVWRFNDNGWLPGNVNNEAANVAAMPNIVPDQPIIQPAPAVVDVNAPPYAERPPVERRMDQEVAELMNNMPMAEILPPQPNLVRDIVAAQHIENVQSEIDCELDQIINEFEHEVDEHILRDLPDPQHDNRGANRQVFRELFDAAAPLPPENPNPQQPIGNNNAHDMRDIFADRAEIENDSDWWVRMLAQRNNQNEQR